MSCPPSCGEGRSPKASGVGVLSQMHISHPRPLPTRGRGEEREAAATMPKIDISKIPVRSGSFYPAPFKPPHEGRHKQALGDAGGLTQFGVNLTRIAPRSASALRHWHETEDEF